MPFRKSSKNLSEGEGIIHQSTLSWIVLAVPVFVMLAGGVFWLGSSEPNLGGGPQSIVNEMWSSPAKLIHYPAIGTVLFGGLYTLRALIEVITTVTTITNRRVIFETGLIWTTTMEVNRSVIEGVTVDQWLLGRLLRYANIRVRGIGTGTITVRAMHNPNRFREMLTKRGSRAGG